MAREVKCPACGHEFFVDHREVLAKCFECNTEFNPKKQSHIPVGEDL